MIITSATIDPERFAAHFADRDGTPAPIVEVSGRTYPVEVRYRPLVEEQYDDEEGEPLVRDQTEAIVDAVQELVREGPGDILVFLPGEREIRDTADVLTKLVDPTRRTPSTWCRSTPGSPRPSSTRSSSGTAAPGGARHQRRRDLADRARASGTSSTPASRGSRATRCAPRSSGCPIEPISQASANQRSGRCGRVEAGIAIRLYSEEDFESRPEFTDPEILRTNLASVILQMTALGLGDVGRFPFVDPPDQRNVKAGVQLLEELGALARRLRPAARLTQLGRQLVALPVDPRLARMVVEAERRGCLREVLVITAALSLQDPRERPVEQQAQADQKHARFKDETSDFLTWLNLWRYVRTQQRELSSSAFRRMCRAEYLNYLRIREWQSLESQLRQTAKQLKLERSATGRRRAGRRRHPPGDAVRAALAHRAARPREARLPRRPQRAVLDLPGLRPVPEAAAVRDVRRARRDLASCGAASTPPSSRSGPRSSARTWSSAPTPSRTGPRSAPR